MDENEVKTNDKQPESTNAPEESQEKETEANVPDAQALMLEIAKQKRVIDKLTSEAADYKRKWKDTLSTQEKASMEKAEAEAAREERIKQIERENAVFKGERSYLVLGYSDKQAHDAAIAQYEGDHETLLRIQKEHEEDLLKRAQEDWLKTRPPVQSSTGNQEAEDLFLRGFNSVKSRM